MASRTGHGTIGVSYPQRHPLDGLHPDTLQDLCDSVQRSFIESRLSANPTARADLESYIVGLLASVIASPDNIRHASGSARVAADMLVQLVDEMLEVYKGRNV